MEPTAGFEVGRTVELHLILFVLETLGHCHRRMYCDILSNHMYFGTLISWYDKCLQCSYGIIDLSFVQPIQWITYTLQEYETLASFHFFSLKCF